MNGLPTFLILSALLALVGCGKDNESGRGNRAGAYTSQICVQTLPNGQCGQYQSYTVNNINSGYNFNGVSLNTVQQENPCILQNTYGQSVLDRSLVTTQVNIGTVVANGDMYVGVTSFGDVAAIIGNGTLNPTFVAYLCPRPVGVVRLRQNILVGAYGACQVKPITVADIDFTDGTVANFRSPSPGGSSARQRFSFCAQ